MKHPISYRYQVSTAEAFHPDDFLWLHQQRRNVKQKMTAIRARHTASKPKKSVSFATTASVKERPISQQELDSMWYQREEYTGFDTDRQKTLSAVQAVQGELQLLDPNEHCLVGLEHYLCCKRAVARKFSIMKTIRLVLQQQHLHRKLGVTDPYSLQAVCEIFSKGSLQTAHLRALLHASDFV
jgi:hypothetical protein